MAGKLWVPTTVLLIVALILSILVSLSLPFLPFMDVSRVSSKNEIFKSALKELRFGIWAACSWTLSDIKTCTPTGHGYIAQIRALSPKGDHLETVTITAAWTRGLAAHPFATGSIVLALGASLSGRHTVNLLAPLVCLFSAVMILIAFAIELALHLHVKVAIGGAVEGASVSAGPGFWITLVTLILVLAAASIMFLNRRRELQASTAYPMLSTKSGKGFFSMFKKN